MWRPPDPLTSRSSQAMGMGPSIMIDQRESKTLPWLPKSLTLCVTKLLASSLTLQPHACVIMCRRLIIKIPEYHNRLQSVWWCEITWRRGRFAVQPILTYHYANSNYAERRWIPKRIFTAHAQCITLLAAAGWGRVKSYGLRALSCLPAKFARISKQRAIFHHELSPKLKLFYANRKPLQSWHLGNVFHNSCRFCPFTGFEQKLLVYSLEWF